MSQKLQALEQALEETIKLTNDQRPIYMGAPMQLVAVLQAALAVIKEQEARISTLEKK